MDQKIIEKVLFIRRFEEKIIEIYHTDVIKSPVHLSIGQELFSVLLANEIIKEDKNVAFFSTRTNDAIINEIPRMLRDIKTNTKNISTKFIKLMEFDGSNKEIKLKFFLSQNFGL